MSGSFADIGRTAFKLGTKNAVNETAKKLFPPLRTTVGRRF